MRVYSLALLIPLCVFSPPGQDVKHDPSPPGLSVVKLSWTKRIHRPGWGLPPKPDDINWRDGIPVGPGNSSLNSPEAIRSMGPRSETYYYSLKLKNLGDRAITGVTWEYLFTDPGDGAVLRRHVFHSRRKIGARQAATLVGAMAAMPTRVVSAVGLARDKQAPFLERAVFRCVRYADGTEWRHPEATESDCAEIGERRGRKK